jgi:CheY-like chemotaxis protein
LHSRAGHGSGLPAQLGRDRVALGDDAPSLLGRDLAAVDVAEDVALAAPEPAGQCAQGGTETILLVEDDPVVADFVSDLLEDAGFTVTVVHDARTAFERLQHGEQFDLVFSDIIMPGGMNGVELAHRVRAARPAQPILLSTGYIEAAVGQEASAFPLIRKPYRANELTRVVADLIRGGKAA